MQFFLKIVDVKDFILWFLRISQRANNKDIVLC